MRHRSLALWREGKSCIICIMKRKFLALILPILCLASGCAEPTSGGVTTFYASALPKTPVKETRDAVIMGHTFTYYNVYRDDQDNFILKDKTSFISNNDIIFGFRFASGNARAYCFEEGSSEPYECTLMQDKDGERYYSIKECGFQVMIDRSLDESVMDVNIGKMKHWC